MRALATIIGFFAGVAAALTLLINNPLQSALLPVSAANAYGWRALEIHGARFDANRLMNLPIGQRNEAFIADGIETANAAVLILSDVNGQPAALAVRLMALNEKDALLHAEVGVSTYMNVIWPNYGSIFLHGDENRWPIIRDRVLELIGRGHYQRAGVFSVSTVGGDHTVAGGSGAFAGIGGRYTEELYVDTEQVDRYAGRLELKLQTNGE